MSNAIARARAAYARRDAIFAAEGKGGTFTDADLAELTSALIEAGPEMLKQCEPFTCWQCEPDSEMKPGYHRLCWSHLSKEFDKLRGERDDERELRETAESERDAAIAAHERTKAAWRAAEGHSRKAQADCDAAIAAKEAAADAMIRAKEREQLLEARCDRLSAELAEVKEEQSRLAWAVGQAIVTSTLAPGEEIIGAPNHAIVHAVEQLRSELSAAVARATQAVELLESYRIGGCPHEATVAFLDALPPAEHRKCNYFACHSECVAGESFCKGHLAGRASPPAAEEKPDAESDRQALSYYRETLVPKLTADRDSWKARHGELQQKLDDGDKYGGELLHRLDQLNKNFAETVELNRRLRTQIRNAIMRADEHREQAEYSADEQRFAIWAALDRADCPSVWLKMVDSAPRVDPSHAPPVSTESATPPKHPATGAELAAKYGFSPHAKSGAECVPAVAMAQALGLEIDAQPEQKAPLTAGVQGTVGDDAPPPIPPLVEAAAEVPDGDPASTWENEPPRGVTPYAPGPVAQRARAR